MTLKSASGRTMAETGIAFIESQAPGVAKGVYAWEQNVLKESVPIVPVDTGALRGSAYAAEPEYVEDHIIGEVGYGGVATKINPKTLEPTTAYAVEVHENMEAHHKTGQAKYLEAPVMANLRNLGPAIIAALRGHDKPQQDHSGGAGEVT